MFQIDAMSREPDYEQIIHQVEQFILTDVIQPEAQKLLEKGREKMKDLTEMLTALAIAGVTKEEITACVEQAFTEAKELQKGGSQA